MILKLLNRRSTADFYGAGEISQQVAMDANAPSSNDRINGFAFSPDNRLLTVASDDQSIRLRPLEKLQIEDALLGIGQGQLPQPEVAIIAV